MIKIAPSILSADFACLGAELDEIKETSDYIHFDVMDGCFVPNISVGLPVLRSVRRVSDMTIDVHLMIDRPIRYVEQFCNSGADIVTVHVEADTEEKIKSALKKIKALGKKAGVVLKPATPAECVLPFISLCDIILVMTVEPGFGGQSFMHEQLPKIKAIRAYINELAPECELEVDGGIDENTAPLVIEAGANVLVAGSAIFGRKDRATAINKIRNSINED